MGNLTVYGVEMKIKDNCIVSIDYSLKDESGQVMNASTEGEPLVFKYGTGAIIPGLEKELSGRITGDEFSVEIQPADGYGEVNPELYAELKREAFSSIDEIKPGMQFQAQDDKGNTQLISVISADEEKVTVDRNHPLAGKTLFFDIKVVAVKCDSDGSLS